MCAPPLTHYLTPCGLRRPGERERWAAVEECAITVAGRLDLSPICGTPSQVVVSLE